MINKLFSQLKSKIISQNQVQNEKFGASKSEQPDTNNAALLNTDKIKAIVAELTAASETFKNAGFIMEQLDIEVGASPTITPQFRQTHEIPREQEEKLIAAQNSQNILKFVLISLFKSSRMKSLLDGTDMFFYGIEIGINAMPSVKTIFKQRYVSVENTSE